MDFLWFDKLKSDFRKSLYSAIIREKLYLPIVIFFQEFFCNFALIESKFYQNGAMQFFFKNLFKKFFVQLKSRFFSTKKCSFWLKSGIFAHIFPIIIFDIWQIREQ